MRWRTIGLLALILAIVAGAYYALEAKGKKSGDDAKRVLLAEEKEVEKISIKKGEQTLVAKRAGDGWRLIEPVDAKADATEINSLLQVILTARQERTIDEQPKHLAEYGLERPAILLTLTLKGDKALPGLLLGDTTPNGFSVYAKRNDQPAVFLVANTSRNRLDRNAADLRDKTVLALEPDKVGQVELIGKGRSIRLRNTGADGWELTQPTKGRADAEMVRQLLWKIRDVRVKEFLADGAGAKRRYGLDRPDLLVELMEGSSLKRLLLKKAPDPKVGLYALAEPGEGVVTTDARLLTDLTKSPFDLRDRSLLRFETTDVKALTLRRAGQVITVTKEGDLWKLAAPSLADAQPGKVYDLLYSLKELRYHDVVAEKGGDLDRYGLKAPQAEVELTLANGSRLPALLVGTSEKDRLYAKLATAPAVYAIDPKFLHRLPDGPDALKQEARPVAGK